MVNVYAFPPVAVAARYWTLEQPVSRSRSLITGSSYVSAAGRKRILAGFDIAGWPKYSAGYLEALWRLLDGGVHLVRLNSCRIPYGHTVANNVRGGEYLDWKLPPADVAWLTPPTEVKWFDGAVLYYTLDNQDGQPAVRVTGLPPHSIVALPGEFITVWIGNTTETHMVAAEAKSGPGGVAIITLVTAPSGPGQISIGGRESGVFELASDWPKVMNRNRFPENYGIEFRQVFEDERGPFVEKNPWGMWPLDKQPAPAQVPTPDPEPAPADGTPYDFVAVYEQAKQ